MPVSRTAACNDGGLDLLGTEEDALRRVRCAIETVNHARSAGRREGNLIVCVSMSQRSLVTLRCYGGCDGATQATDMLVVAHDVDEDKLFLTPEPKRVSRGKGTTRAPHCAKVGERVRAPMVIALNILLCVGVNTER